MAFFSRPQSANAAVKIVAPPPPNFGDNVVNDDNTNANKFNNGSVFAGGVMAAATSASPKKGSLFVLGV
jgi:hypothetical protein